VQQLNIKNQDACRLAQELAQMTGQSVTQRLLDIGRGVAALPDLDPRHPDEILYDAHGLPKDGGA